MSNLFLFLKKKIEITEQTFVHFAILTFVIIWHTIAIELLITKTEGRIHMASIFDVAKYILHTQGKMSTWKLQKLCYYSQAWALAWTETPIFDEDFEAWANGPVCPELFYIHKGLFSVGEQDIRRGNIDNLSDDEIDTINIVLKDYGNMAPYDLRELSHKEDPWKNARGTLPEGASCNVTITKSSMGDYYGSL